MLLVCLFICSAASFPVEGKLCYVLSYDYFYSPEGKVSIIVKNEVNVACSENFSVMLICEGVNLAELRWSYRSSNSAERFTLGVPFLADNSLQHFAHTIINNHNPAFLTVQLVTIFRSPESNVSANFSSVLTVDLLELENHNITSVSCGDASTYEEKLVTDIIWDLVDTKITAIYQIGVLTSIEVRLRNLVSCCRVIYMYSHNYHNHMHLYMVQSL